MTQKPKILAKNYGFEAIESYNKYVPNSDSLKQPWLPVTSTYDVPFLLRPFVEIKMPQPKVSASPQINT